MPRVTLTHHYAGHKPGAEIDVDASTAKALLRDGRIAPDAKPAKPARKAQTPPQQPAGAVVGESAAKDQKKP